MSAPAIPEWMADAVLGLLATAYERGRVDALAAAAELAPAAAPEPDRAVHTRQEAAEVLRTSKTTIDRLLRTGELAYFPVRGRRMIRDLDLQAYMARTGRTS